MNAVELVEPSLITPTSADPDDDLVRATALSAYADLSLTIHWDASNGARNDRFSGIL